LLLIGMVMLSATAGWTYDGEPTDAELAGWWESLTRAERLAQLRLLDRVEHETPRAAFPTYDLVVTDDEIIARPRETATVEVGHLSWRFTLPEQRAVYEPVADTRWVWAGVGGLIVGVIGGWWICK